MSLEVLQLFLVFAEEELHGIGQVIHVLDGAVAPSEDFTSAVVTGNDNVALVGVDDVVSHLSGIA